jgi:transposase
MQAVTTIGLDIAKSVFQIHGVDAAGNGVNEQVRGRGQLRLTNVRPPTACGREKNNPKVIGTAGFF